MFGFSARLVRTQWLSGLLPKNVDFQTNLTKRVAYQSWKSCLPVKHIKLL